MIARRIPSILPDLTFEEALEITKIHSIAGILKQDTPIITTRPFRSPHHTISGVSLVGGGRIPKPGEISLAHYGVLFLDELPEFNQHSLEVLRGPLEDGIVTISRVNGSFTYPCEFMFVSSMNPCPCGYYGSVDKECTCTPQAISKYMGKISGPLLDRIDIQIEVSPVKYEKLGNTPIIICSKGFEKETLETLDEVILEEMPTAKIGVLSGPSHAEEVSIAIPTALVIASKHQNILKNVQDAFMSEKMRIYTSNDVKGVELGGALKNIIAFCAGAAAGIGLGDNSFAALITRGLKEIVRLGVELGGKEILNKIIV